MKDFKTADVNIANLKPKYQQYQRDQLKKAIAKLSVRIIEMLVEEDVTDFEAELILKDVQDEINGCKANYPLAKLTESLFNKKEEE